MADGRTLTLTVLGDAKSAIAAVDKVNGKLGGLGSGLKTAAKLTAGLGLAAGAAVAGGIAASIKSYAETGDALQKLNQKTGLSVENLSALKYAADLSGGSIEGIEKAAKKMASTIEDAKDGLGTTTLAFDKLGLSVDALAAMSPDEQFNTIALAVAGVEDETQRAALAADVFGKAGTDLLPMLSGGAAGLQQMKDEAHELGVVMSEDDANAAAEFNDNMSRLMARIDAFKQDIARVVIPLLLNLQEWLGPHMDKATALGRQAIDRISAWVTEHKDEIRRFFERVKEVAQELWDNFKTGVDTVLPLLKSLGSWIINNKPVLITAIAAVGAAIVLAMGPGALAILAIAGLITLIGYLRDNWREVLDFVKRKASEVMDWLGSGKGLLVLTVLLGPAGLVLGAVFRFRDDFAGAFVAVRDRIMPIISAIKGAIDGVVTAFKNMPSLSDIPGAGIVGNIAGALTGRASGGPVSAGRTYMVGERGPELFTPRGAGNIIPNHALGGGNTSVYITVQGSLMGTPREFEAAVRRALSNNGQRGAFA